MAKSHVDIDLSKYDTEFFSAAMDRVEMAGKIIRNEARRILSGKLKGNWQEHPPYKGGPIWTEREKGAMVKTIRAVHNEPPGLFASLWIPEGNP